MSVRRLAVLKGLTGGLVVFCGMFLGGGIGWVLSLGFAVVAMLATTILALRNVHIPGEG